MTAALDYAAAVIDYIESVNGTWVGGTNAFATPMLPARTNGVPVKAMFAMAVSSIAPGRYIADKAGGPTNDRYFQTSVQVIMRDGAYNYTQGFTHARTVYLDLERAPRAASYLAIHNQYSAPLYIGTDGDENHLWSISVTVHRINTT